MQLPTRAQKTRASSTKPNQAPQVQARPNLYDLMPGRYPDAIGLPQVISQLANSPAGERLVAGLSNELKSKTGLALSPEAQALILKDPAKGLNVLQFSPGELAKGIAAVSASHQSGVDVPEPPDRETKLGRTFDFKDIDDIALPGGPSAPKEVVAGSGLYRGSVRPSKLSAEQRRMNRVMAEVFQRLGGNQSRPAGQRFEVTYQGQKFSDLSTFVQALRNDGYSIKVDFEQRLANFSGLVAQVPNSNPPQYVDVPAPVMIRTGVKDQQGNEAAVPVSHGELIINIEPSKKSPEPQLKSQIKSFQGWDEVGFFAFDPTNKPSYLGRRLNGSLTGDKAAEAIQMTSEVNNLLDEVGTGGNLWLNGYGQTGVCNDSVGVVQHALIGHTTMYPLMMNDDIVVPALRKKIAASKVNGKPTETTMRLEKILKSIEQMPNDLRQQPDAVKRANASLPWAAGNEPFASSVHARATFSRY